MSFNPFVGPSPLARQHAIYGRDEEIRDLFYLLAAERIVWLHSPSGAGKTSLVQSGLIPRLLKEDFVVLPTIRVNWQPVAEIPQGNRFALSMLSSLEERAGEDERISLSRLAQMSIKDYMQAVAPEVQQGPCFLLIFDQFEEVLTSDPLAHGIRQAFFEELGDLLADRRFFVLFSLREDYLAPLASYAESLPTRMSHLYRLDLLSCSAAKEAIMLTAKDGQRQFEAAAADQLTRDLAGFGEVDPMEACDVNVWDDAVRQVEPVQLQVVCRSLWERIEDGKSRIGMEDLATIGSVDRALQTYYADCVARVAEQSGVQERWIRDWFGRELINDAGQRGQVLRGANSSKGLPNAAIFPLVDAHLVRTERRRGVVWIELAHDRLVSPVRSDNAQWRQENLSVLAQHTESWQQAGRPTQVPRLLLLGDELEAVERWLEDPQNQAGEEEEIYLNICRAARMAEETRQRRARRSRWLWRLGAAAGVVFAAASFWAWQEKREGQQMIAREHERAAGVALSKGVVEEAWADTLKALRSTNERLPRSLGRLFDPRLQPEHVRLEASSHELQLPKGGQFHGVWVGSATPPNVLAVSSRHLIDRFLYYLWAGGDGTTSEPFGRLPISLDEARSYAWDARHERLAVGNQRGQVTLLSWADTGWGGSWQEPMCPFDGEPLPGSSVLSLSISSNGSHLAAADSLGRWSIWRLQDAAGVRLDRPEVVDSACALSESNPMPNRILSLAFDGTGQRLALGSEQGGLSMLSLRKDGDVDPAMHVGGADSGSAGLGAIRTLRFGTDGRLAAGGGKRTSESPADGRGDLALWHPEEGEWLRPDAADAPQAHVVSLAFHPSERETFASGLANGQVLVWRRTKDRWPWRKGTARLELLADMALHRGAVTGLAFLGDGSQLVTASTDGLMRHVSLNLREPMGPVHDGVDILRSPTALKDLYAGLSASTVEGAGSTASAHVVGAGVDIWSWRRQSWTRQVPEHAAWQVANDCQDALQGSPDEGASFGLRLCQWTGACVCPPDEDGEGPPVEVELLAGTVQRDPTNGSSYVFVNHQLKATLPASILDALREGEGEERTLRPWTDVTDGAFEDEGGRRVQFHNVTLNGKPQFIEVQPREEVRIEFDWRIDVADLGKGLDCPSCQYQLYYGLANPEVDRRYVSKSAGDGYSKCLANAVMGPGYRGGSGSVSHSFQAPDRPGVYYVTWRLKDDYLCAGKAEDHEPDIGKALAAVRIRGDYKPPLDKAKGAQSKVVHQGLASRWHRMALDPGSGRVAVASFGPKAWIVADADASEDPSRQIRELVDTRSRSLTDIAWDPGGRRLLTTSTAGRVVMWSAEGNRLSASEVDSESRLLSGVFDPKGESALLASRDGRVWLWDLQDRSDVTEVSRHHTGDVVRAVFSPDGLWILSASRDRTARLWARSGEGSQAVVLEHQGWLRTAEFSPDGRYIATASEDKAMRVWSAMELKRSFRGKASTVPPPFLVGAHDDVVSALAFAPDSRCLATGSLDGKVRLWDLREGASEGQTGSTMTLEGHSAGIADLAFSLDGSELVAASHDATARIWDVTCASDTQESLSRVVLDGHRLPVLSARFVDDETVITASVDGTVRSWRPDDRAEGAP